MVGMSIDFTSDETTMSLVRLWWSNLTSKNKVPFGTLSVPYKVPVRYQTVPYFLGPI